LHHGVFATARLLAAELWSFFRDSTPARERQRYGDMEYDWEYSVNTMSAAVGWRNRLLGVFHSPYQPTDPELFREMMDALDLDFSRFTFIDLGSGKGRTLLMASEYPFRRIIGVELLPDLDALAKKNIAAFKNDAQRCFVLESVRQDAREYEFQNEPLLVYLFNPFLESGLDRVVANLERSLQENPREVVLLYHNPLLENVIASSPVFHKACATHQYSVYRSDLRRAP
jgi:SAM-dependent methyltransferase